MRHLRHRSDPANGTATEEFGPTVQLKASRNKLVLAAAVSLAALLSTILAISTAPGADAQTTVCDRTISEGKSVQRLVDSLNPGQTGCLREGTYYEKKVIFKQGGTQAQRINLRSHPGERAIFRGGFVIRDGANNIGINHLRIDGSYGRVIQH